MSNFPVPSGGPRQMKPLPKEKPSSSSNRSKRHRGHPSGSRLHRRPMHRRHKLIFPSEPGYCSYMKGKKDRRQKNGDNTDKERKRDTDFDKITKLIISRTIDHKVRLIAHR